MTPHYFSPNLDTPRRPIGFRLEFGGRVFEWISSDGVFAKSRFDFGSRLLLESAELPEAGRVLDLGCGSGALGLLAALKAPGCWPCLVDVNDAALECARQNRERVAPPAGAGIVRSSFLSAFRDGVFSAVLFNPPIRVGKAAILEVLQEMPRVMAPGGSLWLVARVQQGARSLLSHMERVFSGYVRTAARKKGYLVLCARTALVDNGSAASTLSAAAGF